MIRGPVLGSVPDPVRTPPNPWAVTQNSRARNAPMARKISKRRKRAVLDRPRRTPRPRATSAARRRHQTNCQHGSKKLAYQPGSPEAMPVMEPDTEEATRLAEGETVLLRKARSRPRRRAG